MTCFLKDNSSYNALFETLELFGECSGLKVNHEKTEIFALRNSTLQDVDFPKHNICVNLKADLHGTTLQHTTSLRQAYDMT